MFDRSLSWGLPIWLGDSTAKDASVVLGWSLLFIKCYNEISDEGGKDTCLLYVWSTRGFDTRLVCRWLFGKLPLSNCRSSLCTLSSLSCSCVSCGGSGVVLNRSFEGFAVATTARPFTE